MSPDNEPPSSLAATVDRVMAVAHLAPTAHVAVIGHRTLPFVLALLGRGCGAVRSLRLGAPAPDCEPADLSWIVGLEDERELDEALRAARWRAGGHGRVVLEGSSCRRPAILAAVRERALAVGLDIVSFDHAARRLVLAPAQQVAMAA
jgi:nitroreductase